MSLPIGLTIFNVILINEFPDYPADLIAGKANIVVRLGKAKSSLIYITAALGAVSLSFFTIKQGLHPMTMVVLIPVTVLTLIPVYGMIRRRYLDRDYLEKMCAITILTNLGYSASFIISLLVWGL